jgi:hypothetical protein
MEQSIELKTLILQLYEGEKSGNISDFAEQLFSHDENFLALGSDPDEWWENPEPILRGYKVMASMDGFRIKVNDLKAYSEGMVGWVVDRVAITLPNGAQIPLRHTYILHKENNKWKIVHAHYSIGVPNNEIE